jgi:hypothetical protein
MMTRPAPALCCGRALPDAPAAAASATAADAVKILRYKSPCSARSGVFRRAPIASDAPLSAAWGNGCGGHDLRGDRLASSVALPLT